MHFDIITVTYIANNTMKKQRSRSMEMRLFWITDQAILGDFDAHWHSVKENLANYYTHYFDATHHVEVRP
jgi:hypothetical protein